MHTIRAAAAAGLIALALSGCAQLTNAWNAVTGAQVTTQQVVILGNTFDAIEATATNYIALPRCMGTNGPICSDAKAVAAIVPAIRSGRVARDNLEAFAAAHPGQLGLSGLYDALKAAVSTIQSIFATYHVGAAK